MIDSRKIGEAIQAGLDAYTGEEIKDAMRATKSKRAMTIFQLAGVILLIVGLSWLAVYCMQNSERIDRLVYWITTGQGAE